MTATLLLSDNGASSGTSGYKLTGGNDGTLQLQTASAGGAATTALTIDNSQISTFVGNVGIGAAPSTRTLQVTNNGNCSINLTDTSTGGANLSLNPPQNSSGYAQLDVSGANALRFNTNSVERARFNANTSIFCLAGGNTSATGTGIAFPATQSASSDANTLDDYEEGTWTPTAGAISGSITSYTSQGTYTKVGRLVTLLGRISLVNVGTASSQLTVGSLPFVVSTPNPQYLGTVREAASTGAIYYIYAGAGGGFIQNSTNGGINWTNTFVYDFSITYFTTT